MLNINADVLECSLARSSGAFPKSFLESTFSPETLEQSNRKTGLHDLIRASLGIEGRVQASHIQEAMRQPLVQASAPGYSTISLPGILSNLANKAALGAYQELPGISDLFPVTSTADFKKFSRCRMSIDGPMKQVPASGEIEHGSLTDDTYENQVETWGKLYSITPQMLRNDDLDQILAVPKMLGRLAKHTLESEVSKLLSSTATETWLGTGLINGDAISLESLDTAYLTLINRAVGTDGTPIDVEPSHVLVTGARDHITAQAISKSKEMRSTAEDEVYLTGNPWQGRFTAARGPYLRQSESDLANWYLCRIEQDFAPIQIAVLAPQTSVAPIIESMGCTGGGLSFRGFADFGIARFDPLSIVKTKVS
ncbi:phage major capsid protein [Novipirellula artificiosorum]|uniref:Uncharacterized protein n=1 Tax=Novipirellula artificiosorum TaxID=2528016 RepID=A0A5C6DN42_9BACT|nr:hypothetical protein [Novipirellula artificiosorum]TWU37277.1 hypothetical protein Poly41_34060 [Novipirellula artificiosorum]